MESGGKLKKSSAILGVLDDHFLASLHPEGYCCISV